MRWDAQWCRERMYQPKRTSRVISSTLAQACSGEGT